MFGSAKLTKEDLVRFKSLMIGDKVMVDCDDVIEDIVDEETLMECLVYMWQQNASTFRKNLPQEIKDWFISRFIRTKGKKFYKGMRFKKSITLPKFDEVEFTSVTTDYDVACQFAFTSDIHCRLTKEVKEIVKQDYDVLICEVTGEFCLNVDSYRDLDEKEFIIYKPSFEVIDIL